MITALESEKNANTQDRPDAELMIPTTKVKEVYHVTAKSNSLTVLKQVQVVR